MDSIIDLAEGNPGAVRTLVELVETQDDASDLFRKLTEHDIRGPLVWVGYKDHCDEDIDAFARKLRRDDPDMLAEIDAYRERLEEYDS